MIDLPSGSKYPSPAFVKSEDNWRTFFRNFPSMDWDGESLGKVDGSSAARTAGDGNNHTAQRIDAMKFGRIKNIDRMPGVGIVRTGHELLGGVQHALALLL